MRLIFVGETDSVRRAGTLALRGGPSMLFVDRASSHDACPRAQQALQGELSCSASHIPPQNAVTHDAAEIDVRICVFGRLSLQWFWFVGCPWCRLKGGDHMNDRLTLRAPLTLLLESQQGLTHGDAIEWMRQQRERSP